MLYFAYGSNMFTPHMLATVPSAVCKGPAELKGYHLFFHKKSHRDDSAKCNIIHTRQPDDSVFGVLYKLAPRYRYVLDRAEGLGYGYQDAVLRVYPYDPELKKSSETGVFAFAYIAHQDAIHDHLLPFEWYKEMVTAGAKLNQLPDRYIQYLDHYETMIDPNVEREQSQRAYLSSKMIMFTEHF